MSGFVIGDEGMEEGRGREETFHDVAMTMYSHSRYSISSMDENNGVEKWP